MQRMQRTNHNYPITITQSQKQTDPQHKTTTQRPIIHVFHEQPNLNMSGSPFLQKTSVKKNQNRFHQSNPDHNLDLDPYKPYT